MNAGWISKKCAFWCEFPLSLSLSLLCWSVHDCLYTYNVYTGREALVSMSHIFIGSGRAQQPHIYMHLSLYEYIWYGVLRVRISFKCFLYSILFHFQSVVFCIGSELRRHRRCWLLLDDKRRRWRRFWMHCRNADLRYLMLCLAHTHIYWKLCLFCFHSAEWNENAEKWKESFWFRLVHYLAFVHPSLFLSIFLSHRS